MRADQALARLFPEHSRSRLQSWLKSGRITIAGASPDPKTKVWGGETVLVSPEPSEAMLAEQAEDIPLQIVFEDDTLVVIDKPVGLVWIGLSTPEGDRAWKFQFDGDRLQNKEFSADAALTLLLQYMNGSVDMAAPG